MIDNMGHQLMVVDIITCEFCEIPSSFEVPTRSILIFKTDKQLCHIPLLVVGG